MRHSALKTVPGLIVITMVCHSDAQLSPGRIELMPVAGKMMVNAVVPAMERQVFGLGVPETIGCHQRMWLVNHNEVQNVWLTDTVTGSVSTMWVVKGLIRYSLEIVPSTDYVDLVMTIENLSDSGLSGVFSFNCVSPARAPEFYDTLLDRTFMSVHGEPVALAGVPRAQGPRRTVGVYRTEAHAEELPSFAQAFEATNTTVSNASWLTVLSKSGGAYMSTTTEDALFLFNNTKFGCIHAAPLFGRLAPHDASTVTSRVYFAKGDLDDFRGRYASDRVR